MAKSTTSFKAGATGNKAGRPPGKTPRSEFRALVGPKLPGLVETLILAAEAGDIQAIRTILDKVVPSLKPTSESLALKTTGTLAEKGEAVIKAMLSGLATPDQAKVAIDVLQGQAKLQEHSDILIRLAELESLLCPSSSKS